MRPKHGHTGMPVRTCAAQDVEAVLPAPERGAGDHHRAGPVRVQVEAGPLRVRLRVDLDAWGVRCGSGEWSSVCLT